MVVLNRAEKVNYGTQENENMEYLVAGAPNVKRFLYEALWHLHRENNRSDCIAKYSYNPGLNFEIHPHVFRLWMLVEVDKAWNN